jgi:two-component system, OmpR family, sensor histidine kinase KdpD
MSHDSKPDPDELLSRIQREEQKEPRGRLKIFLGYAAGVGKTYAMLEAANQRKQEGIDVVVGYVETHGRVETEAKLSGLEVLPRKQISYRGITLTELDVDMVLMRRPQLVLVDELAHTNPPGSRHPKRYHDVEELLAAGIDVYTTLNIQHLESLNDVIAQITGVIVRETIPDSVLDQVTEIELTDLPPDELRNRLQEGKVYIPEQAAQAIQNFFRKGNLTALRELTMRLAAKRVDDQMREYMKTKAIPGPWPAAERLLVGVSSHHLAERLVRSTYRLADELNTEWLAVYVETPGHSRLSPEQQDRVARTLLLAEELGGHSLTLPGRSVSEALLQYAQENNVTKIILGKPLRPRWKEIPFGTIVDQLVRMSGNIDIYIISVPGESEPVRREVAWQPHRPWSHYLWAIFLVLAATGIGALFKRGISPTNMVMVYLLAVVVAAVYLGRGPSILVSILGVLAFDFTFTKPYYTFAVEDTEHILTFIGLLCVGLVISRLTARVRDQADASQRRETETSMLYTLSRELSIAEGLEAITQAVTGIVSQTFGRDVVLLLPDSRGKETLKIISKSSDFTLDENEFAVATWSFKHGQIAGRESDTFAASIGRFIPLKTPRRVVGVLGVKPKEEGHQMTPDQRRLLETFSSQAALAIERAQLAEQAQEAQLFQITERLQTALLNSISHDLRTPLVSITGALSSLSDGGVAMDPQIHKILVETARHEADRMNRLVGNLLNMTRLEAGAMRVTKRPGDIQDAIGTALENFDESLHQRKIIVKVDENLSMVPMDFVLVVQVLVNLIDNALKYSCLGAPVEIHAYQAKGKILVSVNNRGIEIPTEDLERIFEKFYRVERPEKISGIGLGLSICQGIIEAHGGRIWAENRTGGGTTIIFSLPLNSIQEVEK